MERHQAALDAAVEGLLAESLTGLPQSDVVESLQRMEVSLRKASAVGHRLIVESVERCIPGNLACRSVNDFLISSLRISGADAAKRVKGAVTVGTWHAVGGETLDVTLSATAAAVRDGAIGPDHVAAIAKIMRSVPQGIGTDEIAVAEQILSDAARSITPEDVTKIGIHLLAHLDPDGDGPNERERKRRRGLRIGKQGADSNRSSPNSPDRV